MNADIAGSRCLQQSASNVPASTCQVRRLKMSIPIDLQEKIAIANPDALTADGFDDAIIGIAHHQHNVTVAYDWDKCIQVLMDNSEMSYIDALEYFTFNTIGAWVGDNTPIFVEVFAKDEQSPKVHRSSNEVTEPRLESGEVVMEEGVDSESNSNPDSA
jgi:hypothetical protein